MKSLTEKYRPKLLADMRGNLPIVAALKSFVKNPCSKAFLLSGPAGTGKTSAAFALAGELPADDVPAQRRSALAEMAQAENFFKSGRL